MARVNGSIIGNYVGSDVSGIHDLNTRANQPTKRHGGLVGVKRGTLFSSGIISLNQRTTIEKIFSGSYDSNNELTLSRVLVVGGGGGAGTTVYKAGGGGGGGATKHFTNLKLSGSTTHTAEVGSGGYATVQGRQVIYNVPGFEGRDSEFTYTNQSGNTTITCIGGGRGGCDNHGLAYEPSKGSRNSVGTNDKFNAGGGGGVITYTNVNAPAGGDSTYLQNAIGTATNNMGHKGESGSSSRGGRGGGGSGNPATFSMTGFSSDITLSLIHI